MTDRPEGTPEEAPADSVEPAEPTPATETKAVAAPEPEPEPEREPGLATPAASTAAKRRGPAPVAPRAPTPSERAVKVTDAPSRYFVVASVLIFVAILFYGLLGGHGGFLTASPTPTPVPSESAPASASPAASGSAAPSSSAGASGSPAAPSASPAPSAAPSVSAVPSTAASPSPS